MVYLDPFSCIPLGTYKDDNFSHLTYIYQSDPKNQYFYHSSITCPCEPLPPFIDTVELNELAPPPPPPG